MSTSYNFADAQQLLIKPFERLKFVILFILITALSQVAAYFVESQPAFDLLWEQSQLQYGVVIGLIRGTLTGAAQWFILRKYISDWKWILVVATMTTFGSCIRTALNMWQESLFFSGSGFTTQIILIYLVTILMGIGTPLIYGWLQWYVLRPYIINARWWIFIPLIAGLANIFLSVLAGLLYYMEFSPDVWLQFNRAIIHPTLLPATQAIGFCLLKKKSLSEQSLLHSLLALATDIADYWDVKKIEKILYSSIKQRWKTNLSTSIGKLKYLVGVNRNGSMIIYEPINPVSSDNVDQTPLPELASDSSCVTWEDEHLTGFAKFKVVFIPPGILQIYSWRGIPLLWLGVAVYGGIIGISMLSLLVL
ncbi:hypothetical protein [Coleofasciculus sp. E1-EBD-02]|uniref:hypothetical protein n=1 Tax=Coleofasciculus sp. E1-EBD-02 TaxID=3068481 RepID=UPI0032FEF892